MVTINSADEERRAFASRLNAILDELSFPAKGGGRQVALGAQWGVSQKGARKWLEGESIPQTSRLMEMARRYDVNFEWLATGAGPKHGHENGRPSMGGVGSKGWDFGDETHAEPPIPSLSIEAQTLIDAIAEAEHEGAPPEAFVALTKVVKLLVPSKAPGRIKSTGSGQAIEELEDGSDALVSNRRRRNHA